MAAAGARADTAVGQHTSETSASTTAPSTSAQSHPSRWWTVIAVVVAFVTLATGAFALGMAVADTELDAVADTDGALARPLTSAPSADSQLVIAASPAETVASPRTTEAGEPAAATAAVVVGGFTETFDDDTGLERFDAYVFHRNIDIHDFDGFSGGTWSGDHDLACGTPDTQRILRLQPDDDAATRVANSLYTCRNHIMTSMGDVENYSIVAFSPSQVFAGVSAVHVDVNLTDLGNRQWLKIGVLSTSDCPALDQRCMYSDVAASDLPSGLATDTRLIASWSGGLSAGHPGRLMIGDTQTDAAFDAGADKVTRHPVSLVDNGDGTVTFTAADASATVAGEFPECPCRVVFYDHNYTPDKNESGPGTQDGYTWHWDNVHVDG